jgi:hypothetical protein
MSMRCCEKFVDGFVEWVRYRMDAGGLYGSCDLAMQFTWVGRYVMSTGIVV